MDYISLVYETNDGGYLIPDTEHGRECVAELLKEYPTLINRGIVDASISIHEDWSKDDIYVKYKSRR
jgi:hypothetical protein